MDPFEFFRSLEWEWISFLSWLDDVFPVAFVFVVKVTLLIYAIRILFYAFPLYRMRSRRRVRRLARRLNGLGQILSDSRTGISLDLVHIALALLFIAVLALLTPSPVRPTVTIYTFLVSVIFLFIGYKCLHGVKILSDSDRKAMLYLHQQDVVEHLEEMKEDLTPEDMGQSNA